MTWYKEEIFRISKKYLPNDQLLARMINTNRWLQNCTSGVSLDVMADRACISKFHFIKLYKRCYGRTPHEMLTSFRIEQAKKMLAEGQPVHKVCHKLGYRSTASFSALFKKETGDPPSVYVKKRNIE